MDVVESERMLQTFGELIERRLLLGPPGEQRLGLLLRGEVVLDANRIEKAPVVVADAGGGNRHPPLASVGPAEAFLDRVAVDTSVHLAVELRPVARHLLGERRIEDRAAEERFGR